MALVGHSGSGKSSIISLIERFYDPAHGRILYNDNDLQDIDTKWLHQERLAIVQQEPCLFTTTIIDNILYGVDRAKFSEQELDAKVEAAIQ